jgi:hypothetical protein
MVALFLFLTGMTGALAPLSYLVCIECLWGRKKSFIALPPGGHFERS